MHNFALIGADGSIAPRHMKAVKETGNNLAAAIDKHDAVGVIDSYFPESSFFVEFERFDRHVDKLRRKGGDEKIHYVSIASPNYLLDSHIRFALRVGADAICEKPLVLNPWNLDAIEELEKENGHHVNAILQLRLHPAIKALKEKVMASPGKFDVDLTSQKSGRVSMHRPTHLDDADSVSFFASASVLEFTPFMASYIS